MYYWYFFFFNYLFIYWFIFKKGSCQLLAKDLGGLSLSRKSVVRLDVYRGRKTTIQLLVYFI